MPQSRPRGTLLEVISTDIKRQIIKYCDRMDRLGWVANHDGNISVQLEGEDRYWATPTARAKADLGEGHLICVDQEGGTVEGSGKIFSEFALHRRVYDARPEVNAVVHSHAPSATAVGCANQEMITSAIPEAVVSLGPGVPLVGLALPNSPELWLELDPLIPHYDAVMIAGNGILSWGRDLETAFLRMELVEHIAKVMLLSHRLGEPQTLTHEQIKVLLAKREKAGLSLPPDPNRPHWFS